MIICIVSGQKCLWVQIMDRYSRLVSSLFVTIIRTGVMPVWSINGEGAALEKCCNQLVSFVTLFRPHLLQIKQQIVGMFDDGDWLTDWLMNVYSGHFHAEKKIKLSIHYFPYLLFLNHGKGCQGHHGAWWCSEYWKYTGLYWWFVIRIPLYAMDSSTQAQERETKIRGIMQYPENPLKRILVSTKSVSILILYLLFCPLSTDTG